MLDRVIDNYCNLTDDLTPAMKKFQDLHVKDIVSMPPEG